MFACLRNLKQSCIKLYKEQKLFYDQLLKMCRTCSKRAHKSVLRYIWRLWKISKSQIKFQFHWLYFGADFTHDSLGIRSWSFNRNCRLYEGLQLSFRLFALMSYGLGVWSPSSNTVRLVRVHWNDATVARPAAGLHRRVAPRVADGLIGQATSGLSSAIEAPARHREPPCATFSFAPPLASSVSSHWQ